MRSPRLGLLLPLLLCGATPAALPTIDPGEAVSRPGPIGRGDDAHARPLLGRPAPALPALRWLDGRPRSLADLRGRVVVIRSFTNDCPFCASTLPALQRLHERYGSRGVTVLGVYHPKPPAPVSDGEVTEFVRSTGVRFPVAIDEDWRLVRAWWSAMTDGPWTSITWVLDRDGTIRAVHPGGEYHEGGGPAHDRCRADLSHLEDVLEGLIADRAPG